MWRSKPPSSTIYIDVCLSTVQKRTEFSKSHTVKTTRNYATTTNKVNEEIRTFFEQYAKLNQLFKPTDWYQLSSVDERTQQLVSKNFGGSLYRALSSVFPEIEWKAWKFQHQIVPSNFWKEQSNQRKFFDDLGKQLGIENADDWYSKLSFDSIIKNGGRGLLQHFNQSPIAALIAAYPEYKLLPWKFSAPQGFWNSKHNVKLFLTELSKKLSIQALDDWYRVRVELLTYLGAAALMNSLIQKHKGLDNLLKQHYPEHQWDTSKLKQLERNLLRSTTTLNQSNELRTIFEQYAKQHNVSPTDWYQLPLTSLRQNMQTIISSKFGGSMYRTLSTVFPEIEWKAWKFQNERAPSTFWKEQSNQRKFFDDLGHTLGVKSLDDWYEKLSNKEVVNHGGVRLAQGKITSALMAAYPEHNWTPWKFNKAPAGYWKDKSNHRKFFDDLGKKLGIEKMDDWYEKLSVNAIKKNGGATLLNHYDGSPSMALMAVYPEHNWIPHKFGTSKTFWSSKDNVTQYLNELSEKLSIQTLDDWYQVDRILLTQFGASGLLVKYKGLYNFLKEQYPHHPWDPHKFKKAGKKTQRWLAVILKKIFPNEEILEDYIHHKAMFPSSKRPMQLDIYIPSKSLAFEYQGIQHYQDTSIFSPSASYQHQDEEKRALCAANNIKLIEVPYWWNKTLGELQQIIDKSGLITTIHQ